MKNLSKLYEMSDRGDCYFDGFASEKSEYLDTSDLDLDQMIARCHLCSLAKKRRVAFAGKGSRKAKIMVVIEEPNIHENNDGAWFRGASGELARNMIEKGMRLNVEEIYLTAAVKCHSFGGDLGESLSRCKPYLDAEIEALKPIVILALGEIAFFALTGSSERIEAARGRLWRCALETSEAMVAPSFSLGHLRRNPSAKKAAYEDLKLALSALGK
ncbi:MAG: uracil-DNA glycosylase [Helicobacteraceae bacterium]|nr:uracil-DNA glycosylase [Helicobacteraceae bacterium]